MLVTVPLLLAGCGSSADSVGAGTSLFRSGELVLDYPSGWRRFSYEDASSFSVLLGYLATVVVPDPCTRSANEVSCATASYQLAPGSLVVTITSGGGLRNNDLDAMPLTIAGMPASFATEKTVPATLADTRLVWRIAVGPFGEYRIIADLRKPGLEAMTRAVTDMVDSLRFDPPRQSIPEQPAEQAAAAHAALVSALDVLAKDSPAYRCFPTIAGASRRATLSEMPYGPTLLAPIDAVCSVQVESTRFQMWKLTLTIRLAAAVGVGGETTDIIVQWALPDGTPTASWQHWE